jgi:hypothetical protein
MANTENTIKRTVIVEIKYIATNNIAVHTENCKLEISLECTVRELAQAIRLKTGIEDCCKKKGFADFSMEMFYIDFVEPGNSRKASFVLRTDDQMSMFCKSGSKSLSVRIVQRVVSFERGSVNINIVLDKSVANTSTELDKQIKRKSRKSEKKTKKIPDTHVRLKELLLQTDNARLDEDGKSIQCLLCHKSSKLDKCKRSAEGHIKYFNRVHACVPAKLQNKRIDEFFEPRMPVKRPKSQSEETEDTVKVIECDESDEEHVQESQERHNTNDTFSLIQENE